CMRPERASSRHGTRETGLSYPASAKRCGHIKRLNLRTGRYGSQENTRCATARSTRAHLGAFDLATSTLRQNQKTHTVFADGMRCTLLSTIYPPFLGEVYPAPGGHVPHRQAGSTDFNHGTLHSRGGNSVTGAKSGSSPPTGSQELLF